MFFEDELQPLVSRFAIRIAPGAAALVALLLFSLLPAAAFDPDDKIADTVGTIEGDAIAVEGPMTVDVVHGQVKTVLRSGSDVRVKAGDARIDLVEGGQIVICGPAHLSLLKSGGALTVALDTGTVRAHLEHGPALIIYTAQIQAKPIAVGTAPEDILVGFDNASTMCVRATSGAVHLEQQLTGQSIVVPQGGDVMLTNGQLGTLQNSTGRCLCELQLAKLSKAPQLESSRGPAPQENRNAEEMRAKPASDSKSTAKEEAVYQVFMPPLTYDAKLKDQQQDNFDPELIAIVRRVRVRPTLIFQGQVEGDVPPAVNTTAVASVPATSAPPKPIQPSESVVDRVRNFLYRLWNHGP